MNGLVSTSSPPWWVRVAVGRSPKRTLIRAAVLGLTLVVVFRFVLLPIRVKGISMDPTYPDHAVNFINRCAFVMHPPRRGDVVGIRYSGRKVMLLKRIIGLPGERLRITHGIVFINGQPLQEPYLAHTPEPWQRPEIELGANQYFVIGDNRTMDPESHDFGEVDGNRILGKLLF